MFIIDRKIDLIAIWLGFDVQIKAKRVRNQSDPTPQVLSYYLLYSYIDESSAIDYQ